MDLEELALWSFGALESRVHLVVVSILCVLFCLNVCLMQRVLLVV